MQLAGEALAGAPLAGSTLTVAADTGPHFPDAIALAGYASARATLVSIIEDIALPSARAERVGVPRFKHFPDASDERLPKSRGFWLESLSHGAVGPYTPGRISRLVADMRVSVCYRASSDASMDDDIIAFDHLKIASALLSPSNWAQPSSAIVCVSVAGGDLMPSTIDTVDGARLLRIVFPMEYTT